MSKSHMINCVTEINKKSFEFTWVIKNYLVVLGYNDAIVSPQVNVGMDDQIKLELGIGKGSNEVTLYQYLTGVKDTKKKSVEYVKLNIGESPNFDEAGDVILSMAQFLSK
ncbi:hypothetical protein TKK_0004521 [Trichogramma kaykai]